MENKILIRVFLQKKRREENGEIFPKKNKNNCKIFNFKGLVSGLFSKLGC
jgi:hypothetical protein